MSDRAGEVFVRHLELSYALAAVRGAGADEVLIRLAGRPGARVRSFGIVRAATAEIVDRIPAIGDGVGFTRQTLIADLAADLAALEARFPGLKVRAAR